MANFAALFKQEISRLARREVKAETARLAKAAANHRGDIASLKRRLLDLEREVVQLRKVAKRSAPASATPAEGTQVRYSAKGLAKLRAKLGLSAAAMGKLLGGVTAQTVRNYEEDATRPSRETIQTIAALRKMGKREVQALLA